MYLSETGYYHYLKSYGSLINTKTLTRYVEQSLRDKLVEELKRRKSGEEQNLVIHNGTIIALTRHPPQPSTPGDSSRHS